MNIAQSIEQGAQLFPDRVALSFETATFSYAQLNAESNQAANGLQALGIRRGDRVAIWLPNSAAFVTAYFGVQKLGAIAVTINTALKAEEIGFILQDAGARLLITTAVLYNTLANHHLAQAQQVIIVEGEVANTGQFAALLQQNSTDYHHAALAPTDPAVLLYTSGTTGFPKGALLSHGALLTAAETAIATFDLQPEDRVLLCLSMFHSFAQTAALIPGLAAGATLILHRQFELEPVLHSIQQEAATFFFGVPTLYTLLQSQAAPHHLRSVRRWISAGASLPVAVAQRWYETYGAVINEGYGLTEICLGSFNPDPLAKLGSVGRPLPGVRFAIVNAAGEEVAPGELGEVVVKTPSVMLGYWQRPAETAEVLRAGWFYTGDIGRADADGDYYIVDRMKDMVNVGGVKVYPSEVENVLYQHPAVLEAAVYGLPEPLLGEQVQASIVLKADQAITPAELIAFCRQRLAEFKIPSAVHVVEQLPKNRSGKILKRLLREQQQPVQPALPVDRHQPLPALMEAVGMEAQDQRIAPAQGGVAHAVDGRAMGQWLKNWLADQLQVESKQLEGDKPFAEYGMTSVLAVNLASALGDWLGRPVPAILLWNFPTIDELTHHLSSASHLASATQTSGDQTSGSQNGWPQRTAENAVALIGIGCRFPGGANTPEQFWQLLRDGVDTVRPIPASRWRVDDYYDPTPNTPGKMYVRAGHFLDEVDLFDAPFFGITPLEAAAMDPQQRLLLEVCWEALEHANLAADQLRESRTGVYVGAFWDDYSARHLYNADPGQIDSYRVLSNLRGMTAGRLAYVLGLHGPAMQLDTACSSSLLAVHLACQALRTGECDLALAGGVNLVLAPEQVIGLCHMGAVSPDGRCKTFAAEADGFGIGEGAGMVVLKRLADALRDGDQILTVIRGSAVNHDGASNGLTAPNGRAQEAMLRQALQDAGVQPVQIQFVETHGTGTVLGDPIEVQALSHVLGQARSSPLLLGSVKTNIGHLSAAAGIASLIKVTLALGAGEIPPNLHLVTPNPHIPWNTAALAAPTERTAWPAPTAGGEQRRLAGVSSFGLTGTNVHLIVEAPPLRQQNRSVAHTAVQSNGHHVHPQPLHSAAVQDGARLTNHNGRNGAVPSAVTRDRPYHLLTLSAKTEQALAAQIDQVEQWLAVQPKQEAEQSTFADLCYTAATGRSHFSERLAIVAPDLATARTKLQQARSVPSESGIVRSKKRDKAPQIAFLFPGQGPQTAGMGRQLYATQPRFRRTLDECAEILQSQLDQPLLKILYGADQTQADALLNEATYAQPALFAVEYALGSLWRAWGIEPTVVMGHSLGEYAAACLAGVFSLEDGLQLVAARGRLMQVEAPKGRMVAVLGHEHAVRELLAPYAQEVSLAAINTPQSVVIAGDPDAVAAAEAALQRAGLETRTLKIYVASHSPLMEPILGQFAEVARRVTYHRPNLPVVSNLTGVLADEELTTPEYWCRHLREPVQFAQGMATLAALGIDTFIEAGPKATLIGLGQQCLPEQERLLWLPSLHSKTEDWQQLLQSLAALYGRGAIIDWQGFERDYHRTKVHLPRYPFQRQRYWIDMQPQPAAGPQTPPTPTLNPLLGRQVASALAVRNRERLFENRFDLTTLPYLADHALFDQPIVPGAAYFEMILAAGAQLWPHSPLSLNECAIQQGLFLPADDTTGATAVNGQRPGATVQVILSPNDAGYGWQIYSLADGVQPDDWILHAAGQLKLAQDETQPAPVDLAAARARCQTVVDLAAFEHRLREQGITYGPTFQTLTQLLVGEGEALGCLTLPQTLQTTAHVYQLHPALLDGALRVTSALTPAESADLYLPFGVEAFQLYSRPATTRLWSYVERRTDSAAPEADHQPVDLTLLDEAGQVVARLTNFTLRRANRQALLRRQRRLDWLYELAWRPVSRSSQSPFAQATGHWLILADQQGCGAALAAQLEAQGEQCRLLHRPEGADASVVAELFQPLLPPNQPGAPAKLRGVVFLWGLDRLNVTSEATPTAALQLSTEVLHLVQAILQSGQNPRLWFVTQEAVGEDASAVQVHQAPLWGLARTLQAEQPELSCTCVDLTAAVKTETLFAEVWFADQEKQVLLRADKRLAARLVRYQPQTTRPLLLDQQGSYLVTGGLGGLGLQVAQWLVEQGARQLVLAGRRNVITPAAQTAIQSMEAAGAKILVIQADVASEDDAHRLLAASQTSFPLRGVIHAAGVIEDGLLLQQTPERLARVMAAKVAGSWHLHTLTHDLPLDFFACFSSVSSLLGNRGQANYAAANAFMDALAHQRQKEGKPVLSINWGGWAEVGLAAELVKKTAAAGLGAIAPAQGVDLLGLLLTNTAPQVGVLPIDWAKFQQTQAGKALIPLLAELVAPVAEQTSAPALRQQLANAAASARPTLLQEYIQTVVTKLLGTTPADQDSFFLFGLDSLLSIELSNRLAAALAIPLPATLAFRYNTIAALTQFLAELLDYPPAETAVATVATSPNSGARADQPTDWYPQLANQRECFIWHETVTNRACLHIQQTVHIQSVVDVNRLETALQTLVARHEALRTVYIRRGDELLQRTLATPQVDFALVKVQNQPWLTLAETILTAAREPFDLAHGPLLRGHLFSRAANDHLFLLVVHHIAADATALSILVNELWSLYGALGMEQASPLPPVRTTWREFVRWQLDLLQGSEGNRLWHYWQKQIADAPSQLNLPTDYPRPARDSHQGRPYYFELDAALTQQLRHLAQREGSTLYAVLMTGFQLLLHHYTGQRDLLIAAHVANRNDGALADVVGYLADTVPIRARISEDITFPTLLKQVQTTLLEALEHQGFPLRLLAERLGVEADPSQTVLCQVWFTLLPLRLFQASGALFQAGADAIQLGGLTLAGVDLVPAWLGAWYDLELILTEGVDVVFGTIVYKTELFAEATVQRLIADFQTLLRTNVTHSQ